MGGRKVYSVGVLAIAAFISLFFQGADEKNEAFPEVVKIALRDVGDQLLRSNEDSTSLILPVIALDDSKFELSFQQPLSFEPGALVSAVTHAFEKALLPEHYIVEVIQCTDHQVAYSYQMTADEQTTIIPCSGRVLPENCYTIEVRFTDSSGLFFSRQWLWYVLVFVLLGLLFFQWSRRKKEMKTQMNEVPHATEDKEEYAAIGSFQFYPEQNKLVKSAVEISLSRKECELLAIFVASPNQIIKRDEFLKKVWEDQGVFVGRSLDTYISKLRKKLKADDSIKLTNVHGVGYKLEIR